MGKPRRTTPHNDLRATLAALALPRRFRDNGVDLTSLRHTAAFTGDEDQFWLDDLVQAFSSSDVPQAVVSFEAPPLKGRDVLERPTDAIASSVGRIAAEPHPGMPGGFQITIDFDLDRFVQAANVLQGEGSHLSKVLDTILAGEGAVHFQTAQQLGHTLRMVSLNKAISAQTGRPGLVFVVPNTDNAKLCQREFEQGVALPWRQLYEPGYCLDPRLVFPMDPDDGQYFHTVVLAAALNRHILALAMAAARSECQILWTNDSRHEGPALFWAFCHWLLENSGPHTGHVRLFQLTYLLLDPLDHMPPKLRAQLRAVTRELIRKAQRLYPGIGVADGHQFMRHKMCAQALVSEMCERYTLPAEAITLYMTPFQPGALRMDLRDARARELTAQQGFIVVPEIAANHEVTASAVDSLFVSLGISGHCPAEHIVVRLAELAAANPQIKVTLAGKGTDSHSLARVLKGKLADNLLGLGVIPAAEHDQLMAQAQVVVIKTTRNTRAAIAPAFARRQGVLLIPPDIDVPDNLETLYSASYLCETAVEHLNDLEVALALLKQLGVNDPQSLILDLDTEFASQVMDARRAATAACLGARKGMGTPDDLARVVLDDWKCENLESF